MSTTRIRDKQVHVFMTEGEREKLKRRARKYGMGVGEFIRQALIHTDALKVTVIDLEPLNRANYELHKAGVNLNALLKRFNTFNAGAYHEDEVRRAIEAECEAFCGTMDALIALRKAAERHKIAITFTSYEEFSDDSDNEEWLHPSHGGDSQQQADAREEP